MSSYASWSDLLCILVSQEQKIRTEIIINHPLQIMEGRPQGKLYCMILETLRFVIYHKFCPFARTTRSVTLTPMAPTNELDSITTSEGEMIWDVSNAGKECKTWYRIYGNLNSGVRPLVVLHGGPGVTSDYLSIFSDLTLQRSIPVIIYDQLGNGLSTHLPEKMGDITFWTEQLFLDELKHLLEHLGVYHDYDLLGHSWGGMLGARHAVRQPGGLKRLVIMSSPASNKLWIEAQEILRRKLPQDVQDVLDRCERDGKTDSKEYQDAVSVYYSRFLCTLDPMPEALRKSFEWMEKDPTVYLTMSVHPPTSLSWSINNMSRNGPSEFYMTGPIKDWTILDEAHKISVPTLLTNGWKDEAADSCVYPFFKLVPRIRWIQFAVGRFMLCLNFTRCS